MAVNVIQGDWFAPISAAHEVLHRATIVDPDFPWHVGLIAWRKGVWKHQEPSYGLLSPPFPF